MKRLFDLLTASALLIVLSPVIMITAVVVRVSLGSPVIFRQRRPGLTGQSFMLFKFRTMLDARSANAQLLPDDERMTSVGNFLRSSSLDELPALFNVIRGEMSLVGPRPLLMEYLPLYSARQNQRHNVRPGLTGWAQVNGRNLLSWPEKLELDVWYVENRSFWLDLKILFMTVGQVLRREGISHGGHVTMEHFKGNRS